MAGNRNLLNDGRHTLFGIVLTNATAVTAPSVVSYVPHTAPTGNGTLHATWDAHVGVEPAINLTLAVSTAHDLITFTVIDFQAAPGQVTDLLLLHVPVRLPTVAGGLVTAFDDNFALLLLPADARTRPLTAAPVGSSANIAWPPAAFGQSCNSTATGVSLTALCARFSSIVAPSYSNLLGFTQNLLGLFGLFDFSTFVRLRRGG